MSVGLGDLPTWISALTTASALIFVARAAVFASRTFRIESSRDQLTSAERQEHYALQRQGQAAQVSAWWEIGAGWTVRVRNASSTPVYQAHLRVLDARSPASPLLKLALPVVPPGDTTPGDTASVPVPHDRQVSLTFTDANGVRWQRDRYGRLLELQPQLLIWVGTRHANALAHFAPEFQARYGVTVELAQGGWGPEVIDRYASATPKPDAICGPHDWIGMLVDHEVIEPVHLSEVERAAFDPRALKAVTYDGQLYGIPGLMDTMALFRNVSLVPEVPGTFEELVELGRSISAEMPIAIEAGPHGNAYHLWPLLTGAGGWLFGQNNAGDWDPDIIGIDSPESIAALDLLRGLGSIGQNLLRSDMDASRAHRAFATGQTPFLLNPLSYIANTADLDFPVAVSHTPGFGGRRARPFLTVHGYMITRGSPNKLIVQDLLPDYITRPDFTESITEAVGLMSPLRMDGPASGKSVVYQRLCQDAMPMPSFPQMVHIWPLLATAQVELMTGAAAKPLAHRLAGNIGRLW